MSFGPQPNFKSSIAFKVHGNVFVVGGMTKFRSAIDADAHVSP